MKKASSFACLNLLRTLLLVMAVSLLAVTNANALNKVNGVYQLGSCQDMVDFAKVVNDGSTSANAVVTAPIDMSCSGNFPMIGNGSKKYSGSFNGQGYPISNLKIVGSETQTNVGLFGVISGGSVSNIVLANASISATKPGDAASSLNPINVGVVAGLIENNGSIDKAYASGSITTSGNNQDVGGVVGNLTKGSVKNALSTVSIASNGKSAKIGGVVGENKGTVTQSVYDGKSLSNNGNSGSVGGIVGSGIAATESFSGLDGKVNTTGNVSTLNNGGSVWSVGENIVNSGITFSGSTTLVAATFDANGGKFSSGSASLVKGFGIGASIYSSGIEKPTREGFTFAGWALTKNAVEASNDFGNAVKGTTLYAVWKEQLTITFNINSEVARFPGSVTDLTRKFDLGSKITSESIPSPADYEHEGTSYKFLGWALTSDAEAPVNLGVADVEKTIYAVWKESKSSFYTLTFEMGGHGYVPAQNIEAGTRAVKPEEPSVPGYTFGGWFTSTIYNIPFSFVSEITGNTTVYAKWTANEYTITYNLDGGVNNKQNPATFTVEKGAFVLEPATKDGFVFEGWFADESKTIEKKSILENELGDVTVYAKWRAATYKISYLAGGDGVVGNVPSGEKSHGADYTLSSDVFTRSGYTQSGWSTVAGGDKVYELGATYAENKDLTLYPYWGENGKYSLKYDTTSAAGKTANYLTLMVEAKAPHYLIDVPEKDGYKFGGWKVTKGGVTVSNGKFSMPSTAVEISGKYELVNYTIAYETNGAAAIASTTYNVEKAVTLPIGISKTGFTFEGWFDNPYFNGEPVTELTVGNFGNKTFYAKWQEQPKYEVQYHLIDKLGVERTYRIDRVSVGDKYVLSGAPEANAGYTFNQWYSEDVEILGNTFVMPEKNVVVKGSFVAINYTITWNLEGGIAEGEAGIDYTTGEHGRGTKISVPTVTKTGYEFAGWSPAVDEYMPARNVTYTAIWTPAEVAYKVKYNSQNISGSEYTLDEKKTVNAKGLTESVATYENACGAGFALNSAKSETKRIAADGSTVVNVYCDRNVYEAVFKNGEDVLYTAQVRFGATPEYIGSVPTKAATAEKTFNFTGWDPAVSAITENAVYSAQFEESAAKYTLTWNFDGGVVSGEYTKGEVTNGAKIDYPASVTKTGYEFVWNPASVVNMPASDLLLSAVWSPIKYVLTLKYATASPTASEYAYGTEVTLTAETPVNSHFVKWSDGVTTESRKVTVSANATYEAEFEANPKKLTVTYSVPAGVKAPATVEKFLNVGDNYSVVSPVIEGYTADKSTVSGKMGSDNVDVVVEYTINKFTVTYQIKGQFYTDDQFDVVNDVAYGTKLSLTKKSTDRSGYVFSGWSGLPATMPNGNVIVQGYYDDNEPVDYKIVFRNGAKELQAGYVNINEMPVYDEDPPVKPATEMYTYTFKGWKPAIVPVSAPAVYEAQFDSSLVNYAISLTNAKVSSATAAAVGGKYAYGTRLTLTPVIEEHSHFTQWSDGNTENPRTVTVSGNASYTAESAVNSHVLTITYETPDGVTAPAKVVKTLNYNADYDVASPALEGYTAGVASVSGKMPDADVNEVVTYAPKRFAVELVGATATPAAGEDGKYAYGTKLTLTPVVPEHSHFTQWSDGNTSNPRVVTVVGDADYTAESSVDSHVLTITYNVPEGATAPAKVVKEFVFGDEYSIVSPEIVGYAVENGKEVISGTMAGSDVNKTVNYTANSYTITLNTNGGETLENVIVKYGAVVNVPEASRTGYTFAGWVPAVPATMPAENITLTASWTVKQSTMTFNTNGGNVIQPVTMDYGAIVTAPVAPTKKGFVFAGWFADESLETAYPFSTMPVEDVVVYAKWEGAKRTISLNLNGGELGVDSISGAYGSVVSAPADPTKNGYTFAGWFADAQFTKAYTFTTIPMEDIIVYAKWNINSYTIAFNSNGGSAVDSISQPFKSTVKAPAEPKKSGYVFEGWYGDKELTVPYEFGTMPSENITVYAKWSLGQFEIAFESNGGSAVETIRQDYNSAVTKPADPTKEGHSFAGWFADESLETAYTFSTMPAEKITVYAKWNVNQYTITFNSDGGSVVAPIELDYGSEVVAPASPTKVGYTFKAWVPELPETMPAENKSVTATWIVNSYKITYELDGGVGTTESTHEYGTKVTAPVDPTKMGYKFDGWYTEKALVNKYEFGGEMPAKPFKLYAKWIPQTETKYVVTRYFQNVDDDEYTQDKSEDKAYFGPTGSMTILEPAGFKGYEGFLFNESKSRAIAISADGSTVVNAYYDRNEYSVIFKSEGKTFLTSHFRYGAKPVKPIQVPEKKPDETSVYKFDHWNPLLPETMPAHDITVEAVFDDGTKVKYQLVWDFDGGVAAGTAGVNYTAGQVTNGDAITYPSEVTMEGHTLTSWDPAGVTNMPKNNLKLKAVWTPNDYTITLKGATVEKDGVMQSSKSCNEDGCKYIFPYGTQLSLHADIPAEKDEHFVSWKDGTEAKPIYDNPRKVVVKGDASYETVYETETDKNFHKLTITYVAPAEVVVPMEKVNQYVKNGLPYNVESPEIEGYTADKPVVSGTMGNQDVSVTVNYSVNKHKVVYKVVDKNGDYFTSKIYEFERDYGAILRGDSEIDNSITSSKMKEEGYTFSGWQALRPYKMPDEDVVITGYYTRNSYKLQIVYVMKDGPLRSLYATSGSYEGRDVVVNDSAEFGSSYSHTVEQFFTDRNGTSYSIGAPGDNSVEYTVDRSVVYIESMPAHDVREVINLTAVRKNVKVYYNYGETGKKSFDMTIPVAFKNNAFMQKIDSALTDRNFKPPMSTDTPEPGYFYFFKGWSINPDSTEFIPTFEQKPIETEEIEVTYTDKNGVTKTVKIQVPSGEGVTEAMVSRVIDEALANDRKPREATKWYSFYFRGWKKNSDGSYSENYSIYARDNAWVNVYYDEDNDKYAQIRLRWIDVEPEHAINESGYPRPETKDKVIASINKFMDANGYAPTKERDAQYYYTFDVKTNSYTFPKDSNGVLVSRPDWTKTLRQYPITFKNGKTDLKTIRVDYGTVPAYDGETPTKEQTTEFEYTFSGWDPALEKVTGTFEYTAKFEQHLRKYKLNYEGATAEPAAEDDMYEYGTEVTLTAAPEEFHHFTRWSDGVTQDVRKVTVDEKGVTYSATNEPNKYILTVEYANPNEGRRTSHEVLAYGETRTFTSASIDGYVAVPANFTVTMPGKDSSVAVRYEANKYEITLVNATASVGDSEKDAESCNEETHACVYEFSYGTVLTLTPVDSLHYHFTSWNDGVADFLRTVVVTGNAKYAPEYSIDFHKLTIVYSTTTGAEAPKTYEKTLNYGTVYSVPSPDLEGHIPDQSVIRGTLTEDVNDTVEYSPKNYTLTIHYVKKNGETVARDYVDSEVPYLSEFSVESPAVPNFTSDSAVVKGVMNSVDGMEVTISYTGNPYTVTAKYIPVYGSETTEQQEVHVTYDYSHADIENAINDVLESNDPVIVPQKTYSLTEKFTFNKKWTLEEGVTYIPNFDASPRGDKLVTAIVTSRGATDKEYSDIRVPDDSKTTDAEIQAALNTYFSDKSIVPLKASTLDIDYTFNNTWTLDESGKYTPNFDESERAQITVIAVVTSKEAADKEYNDISVPADGSDEEIYEAINRYFEDKGIVPIKASSLDENYKFNGTWTKVDGKYIPNFDSSARKQKTITVVVNGENKSVLVPANGSHAEIDEAISVDIYDKQEIRPVQTSSLTHDYTFVDRTNASIDHWKEFDDNIYIPVFDSTERDWKYVVAAANGNEYRPISVPNDGKQTPAEISAAINVHFADHGIAKPKQASTLTVDYAFTDTWQKNGTSGGLDRYIPIFNESARPQTTVQVQFANAVQKVTEPADVNVPTDGTVPEIYKAIRVAFPNPTHEDRDSTYDFKCWTPEFDKNCATQETLPGKLADKKTPFVANLEGSVKKTSVIVANEKVDTTYVADDKTVEVEIDVPDLKDPSKVLAKVNSAGVSEPTKKGYTFKAWDAYSYSPVAAADFENAYNAMPVNGTAPTNIVYLAGWTINQYTVTFHGNGGTIDGKTTVDSTWDYNSAIVVPTVDPTRTNYTFDGWNLPEPATVPAENITVNAKWKPDLIKVVFSPANMTYTGTVQAAPTIKVYITGDVEVSPDDYIVSGLDAEFKDAGDYTITVKGKEGSSYSTKPYTVKYTVKPASFEIALSENKTYNGLPQEPTLAVTSEGAPGIAAADYDVAWDKTGYTDAGSYKVSVTGKGNYTGTKTATYVINRASVTVTANNGFTKVYGVEDPKFTATVTGLVNNEPESKISYTLPRIAGENVGTYKINPSGETDQGNYTITYESADFTITKNNENSLSVEMKTISTETAEAEWTYSGEKDHKPVPTVKESFDPANVKFHKSNEPTYTYAKKLSEDTWENVGTTVPVNVGTYKVTASIADTENYNGVSAEKEFTITKYEANKVEVTLAGWIYDETAHIPTTVVKFHGEGEPVIKYAVWEESGVYADEAWSTEAKVDAGSYIVKASVEATENYNGTKDSVKYVISPANLATVASVILDTASIFYNKEAHNPQVTVKRGETVLVLGRDYDLSWDKLGFQNADTYTVTVTGKGNYTGTNSATYVIKQAPIEIVLSEDVTYSGEKQIPTVTLNNKEHDKVMISGAATEVRSVDDEYDVAWSYKGVNFSLDDDDIFKEAGVYTITVKGKGNYDGAVVEKSYTIAPKLVTITVANASKTYGQDDPDFTGDIDGLVKESDLASVSYFRSNAAEKNAGNYTGVLDVTYTANDNYDVTVTKGDFEIMPYEVTVTAEEKSKEYGKQDPDLTAAISNLPYGEKALEKITVKSITREAGETVRDGGYVITPSGDELQGNYKVSYVSGKLTINQAIENTVKVSMEDWDYGDTPASPEVVVKDSDVDPEHVKFHAEDEPTITYATWKESGEYEESDWSEIKPVKAGTYVVKADIAETPNYVGASSDMANLDKFTIKAAPIEIVMKKSEVPYNGEVQKPNIKVLSKVTGKELYAREGDYTIRWDMGGKEEYRDVAVYKFTVEAEGNYSGNYADSYEIYKAEPKFTVTLDDWTYGETANEPVVEKQSRWIVGDLEISYAIRKADGSYVESDWSKTVPTEAGDYVVKAFVAGTDNYNAASVLDDFTIKRADVTITVADASKTYGEADPAFTGKVEGLVKAADLGEVTYSRNGAGQNAGTYTDSLIVSYTDNANYAITVKNGTFTINPAPITVTVEDKTKQYSETDPTFTAQVTGFVNGEESTVNIVYELNRESGENVGSYDITATGEKFQGNYEVTYVPAKLIITQNKTNEVTVAMEGWTYTGSAEKAPVTTATFKVDGEPAVTYVMKGSESDESAWTTTRPVDAGTYVVKATVAETDNYVGGEATSEFTIAPAAFTIALSENKVYTGVAQTPTLTVTSEGAPDISATDYDVVWTKSEGNTTEFVNADAYTVTVTGKGNYTGEHSATYEIVRAEVSVTPNANSKTYGSSDPTFTAKVEGLVNDESENLIAYAITRTTGENVGEYDITASGDEFQGNYHVTYGEPAVFKINKKPVTITVADASKTYGQNDPEFTGTVVGLVDESDLGTIAYSRNGEGQNVGTYTDSLVVSYTDNANYTITVKNGTFTIKPAAITVTVEDKTKQYSETDPTFTAQVTGFVNGEESTVNIVYELNRESGENVGFYYITATGDEFQGNYEVTYVPAKLNITQNKTNKVTVAMEGWTYTGSAEKAPVTTATFKVDGEPAISYVKKGSESDESAWTTTRPVDAGTYVVKATVAETDNYVGGEATSEFTIAPAAFTIALSENKVYTGVAQTPTLTVTSEGAPGISATDYDVVWTKSEGNTTEFVNADAYTVTVTGKGNYTGSHEAKFTISRANVTVTADSLGKIYGSNDPDTLTTTITGLVNNEARTLIDFAIAREEGESVGTYVTTATGNAIQGNYNVAFVTGKFVIAKKPVVITVADASKTYGEADPAFTGKVEGLVDDADLGTISYVRSNAEQDVGSYLEVLTASYTENGNYDVSIEKGDFEITKRSIILTSATDRKFYDGTALVNTEVVATLNGETATAQKGYAHAEFFDCVVTGMQTDVGVVENSFTCTPNAESGAKLDNYEVAYAVGTLTVDPVVTFVMNGHGEDIPVQNILLNEKAVAPAEPTTTGYTFAGWFVDNESFTTAYDFNVPVTENKTLFAKWIINDYIITFKNGDEVLQSGKVTYGEMPTYNGETPVKESTTLYTYEFKGWSPVVAIVSGDAVYEAQFNQIVQNMIVVAKYGENANDTLQVVVPATNSDEESSVAIEETRKNHVPEIATPAKAETADSTYEFVGWVRNNDNIFVPNFESFYRPDVIIDVAVNDSMTVPVVIRPADNDSVINAKIDSVLSSMDIEIAVPDQTDSTEFVHDGWNKNEKTEIYEPVFDEVYRVFDIVYVAPNAELSDSIMTYVYGTTLRLPTAYIPENSIWKFKGWYTKPNGLGKRIKSIVSGDFGNKKYYAFFQASISYEVGGSTGRLEIAYSEDFDKAVASALASVVPDDFEKDGVNMTFGKWERIDESSYRAIFVEKAQFVKAKTSTKFHVAVRHNTLVLSNAAIGTPVLITNLKGVVIYKDVMSYTEHMVNLSSSGSYIVRVGNEVTRVNVK